MTRFMQETIDDMRCGRQNWRVVLLFCGASFLITVVTTVAVA